MCKILHSQTRNVCNAPIPGKSGSGPLSTAIPTLRLSFTGQVCTTPVEDALPAYKAAFTDMRVPMPDATLQMKAFRCVQHKRNTCATMETDLDDPRRTMQGLPWPPKSQIPRN